MNRQVEILTVTFNDCLEACAPIVTKVIRRPPAPWMTEEIKVAITERDRLRTLRDHSYNEASNALYKLSKKQVKTLIKNAKVQHYRSKFQKCKASKGDIWDVIGEIVPSKKNVQTATVFSDPVESAIVFNSFFSNVGKNVYEETQQYQEENVEVPHQFPALRLRNDFNNNVNRFRPRPVQPDTVADTVKKIKTKNSYGADGITSRFLKDSMSVLTFYLTVIINTSIVTGSFPGEWKHAVVCPLHKKGEMNEPSNFRPVSLLPVMSKVLEKVVTNQLYEYLSENNLLSNTQHGFRSHLSTETALSKITETLYGNIDRNELSLLTLCDLSKAFDSVCHPILLRKMENLNIDDYWFRNYLENRTQSVKINKHISEKEIVEYGVPQGSVLGPILFNIFINDLTHITDDCELVQYADDSQFVHSGKIEKIHDLVQQTERTVERANRYFSENGLKVNADKTKFMFVGSRQYISRIPNDLEIRVGSSNIKPSTEVKNLGVIMDQFLSFEEHIREMCFKANGILYFLNRNKEFLDTSSRKIVVESLISSIFSYCSVIWSACGKTSLARLQKVQNFASKVATGRGRKYDHATPLINELGWLKIEDKVVYDICLFVFKVLNEEVPHWVVDFKTVMETRERLTRQSSDLAVPRRRTKIADKAMSVRGPKLWNNLPEDLKNIKGMPNFKKHLKGHFKGNG